MIATTAAQMGRRQRRRLETRQRLFRAALELFSERVFMNTTVEDITEAADLGKGTFFNHFPSKEHVLSVFAEVQLAKVETALAETRAGGEPVREIVRRLLATLALEPGRSQTLARSMLLALLSNDAMREVMVTTVAKGRKGLLELFTLAQARGEIAPGHKPAVLARIFQQTFFGTLALWSLHDEGELTAWLAPSFDLLWAGATAEPARKNLSRTRRRQP